MSDTDTRSPLDRLRDEIRQLLEDREQHQSVLDEVIAGAEERDDSALTGDEQARFDEARDAIRATDEKRKQLEQREQDMLENERARQAALDAAKRYGGDQPRPARVTSEPATYRAGGEHGFFRDAFHRRHDPEAADRIARHQREMLSMVESRTTVTGGLGDGLVVPQFLTEMFAEVVRAGRPLLNSISQEPLPTEGLEFTIPRGTTGTIVSSQTTEGTQVANRDYTSTDLTIPVVTIAGQVDLTRQVLDRGRGVDTIIMRDLASAYATETDRQAIAGTGSNNQYLGILSTTNGVTTVSVTTTSGITLMKHIADGIQRINSNRFMPPTVIYMHPRRWGALLSTTDTTNRPLVLPGMNNPQNAQGVGNAAAYGQIVGEIQGVPVITDANIPTSISSATASGSTEDAIIISRAPDLHWFGDDPGPTMVEFQETLAGALVVKVVAWGYSAFTAGRYGSATAILSGSGLTTPTFA